MTQVSFEPPKLTAADEALIDAYLTTGLTVDELAYTDAFDSMCERLGRSDGNADKHEVYKRLLTLRKLGRLPRAYTRSN